MCIAAAPLSTAIQPVLATGTQHLKATGIVLQRYEFVTEKQGRKSDFYFVQRALTEISCLTLHS